MIWACPPVGPIPIFEYFNVKIHSYCNNSVLKIVLQFETNDTGTEI